MLNYCEPKTIKEIFEMDPRVIDTVRNNQEKYESGNVIVRYLTEVYESNNARLLNGYVS